MPLVLDLVNLNELARNFVFVSSAFLAGSAAMDLGMRLLAFKAPARKLSMLAITRGVKLPDLAPEEMKAILKAILPIVFPSGM